MPKLDPFSFFLGFAIGILFYWLAGRVRPLLAQTRENMKEQREVAQVKRTSGLEDNHRRLTLRRAQGMHLAASLFSLDEILPLRSQARSSRCIALRNGAIHQR